MSSWRACAPSFRRHRAEVPTDVVRFADVTLNPRTRQVYRDKDEIQLTAKEFDLLELFMRHPNQVLDARVDL